MDGCIFRSVRRAGEFPAGAGRVPRQQLARRGPERRRGLPAGERLPQGHDFIVIAEIPRVKKSDLNVQVKGRTLRLSGVKAVAYAEKAAVHRRERLAGRFDRAVTLPVEINPDSVKAEYRDGVLGLVPAARREREAEIDQVA
jgi:HSP20 family molecular chaperone IbpA